MKLTTSVGVTALLLALLAPPSLARVPAERILFASFHGSSTGIRSIKPNGDGRRTLTDGEHINPRWSPDRSQVAFEKAREGNVRALLVAGKDGSNRRRVVTFRRAFYREGFDWSPDGTKIVYAAAADARSTHDIYVVEVASGHKTRLTDHPGEEYEPVWSPDGSRIAYTADAHGGGPIEQRNAEIAVMDADGSNPTLLTDHPHDDYAPQWSPNGSLISFASQRDDPNADNPDVGAYSSEIYVMDIRGENERRVTDHFVHKDEYEWSPDGTRFAYVGRCDNDVCRDAEADVYVIDLDGSGRRNLTNDDRLESSQELEWSPNGSWVAYAWVQRGGRSQDLMLVAASGDRRIKRVTDTRGRAEADLNW